MATEFINKENKKEHTKTQRRPSQAPSSYRKVLINCNSTWSPTDDIGPREHKYTQVHILRHSQSVCITLLPTHLLDVTTPPTLFT